MTNINEIAQSPSTVKTPTTTVNDSIPAPSSASISVEQGQTIRQDAAAVGKQVPPSANANMDVASDVQVMQAVQEMKDYAQSIDRDLKFNVDNDSGRLIITVIDPETDKIVRQIPPEDTLYILRNMQKGGGALFDNKV